MKIHYFGAFVTFCGLIGFSYLFYILLGGWLFLFFGPLVTLFAVRPLHEGGPWLWEKGERNER